MTGRSGFVNWPGVTLKKRIVTLKRWPCIYRFLWAAWNSHTHWPEQWKVQHFEGEWASNSWGQDVGSNCVFIFFSFQGSDFTFVSILLKTKDSSSHGEEEKEDRWSQAWRGVVKGIVVDGLVLHLAGGIEAFYLWMKGHSLSLGLINQFLL